jgi:gamma-glutamyltranspeptidase/glutathione hydrolase
VTLAEIFNVLEGYDLGALGYHSPKHIHLWTEAVKRAFVDRNAYLADPDFVPQPVDRMISDAYAAERRRDISMDRATPAEQVRPGLGAVERRQASREGEHTTHYSIVDAAGNAVAVTTTINSLYGNLVTVAGAGFLLNNEMDDFATRPGTPNQFGLVQGEANAIEPGKRMLSAMTPTIVEVDGELRYVVGTPGGPTIITTVAQVLIHLLDYGMTMAEAVDAKRLHHQHLPDVVRVEPFGFSQDTVDRLTAMGHEVGIRGGYSGRVEGIEVDRASGFLFARSDLRGGGYAAGY